jgi:hypothetical protein
MTQKKRKFSKKRNTMNLIKAINIARLYLTYS